MPVMLPILAPPGSPCRAGKGLGQPPILRLGPDPNLSLVISGISKLQRGFWIHCRFILFVVYKLKTSSAGEKINSSEVPRIPWVHS